MPSSRNPASTVYRSLTRAGARPREGSSSIRIFGPATRPRAIASICCSPPESSPARPSRRALSAGNRSSMRSISASASAVESAARIRRARCCPPRSARETPAGPRGPGSVHRRRCGGRKAPPRSCPAAAPRPPMGRCRPLMARMRVDLPAPLAAEDGDELAFADGEIDPVQHRRLPVPHRQSADRQQPLPPDGPPARRPGDVLDLALAEIRLQHRGGPSGHRPGSHRRWRGPRRAPPRDRRPPSRGACRARPG